MFSLPDLPYEYDALEPVIDAQTMEIHHTKHHQGYVNNLKQALEKYPDWQEHSLEELLADIEALPEDIQTAVRNNGGGHANHSLFWTILSPDVINTEPEGNLADAMTAAFGSFGEFKELFTTTAMSRFGSGWAWLVVDDDGDLQVYSTANQDSPLMEGDQPILGVDVWEHAYYLNYQNRRAEYLEKIWQVIHWEEVSRRYEAATA